jgi:tetratricopeptide (TPR) repeat protein
MSILELKAVRPLWRWLTLLGIMTVVLVPASFGGVWVYHVAKVWRAHSLAEEASDMLSRQAPAEAESKLMAAYHLAPYDAEVLRACARYESARGNSHALGFYHLLIALPKATRMDQRDALRACLVFGDLKAAKELAKALIAKNPEAEDYALEGQVSWQEHTEGAAIALMRQALALDPENRPYRLLLAQMLNFSANDEIQKEAVNMLRTLAQTHDKDGLKALVVMSRNRGLDEISRRWILEQLRQHPLLDDSGRFAAWELETRLGGRDPKIVLQGAVDFFKSSNLSRKSMAARWLYNQGEPELALELASPSDVSANQDLLLVRLDALASLKNWPEVEKELATLHVPLSQMLIFLYRARAAQELGDPARSKVYWEQARTAAAAEAGMLSYLGNYALKLGLYDEAKRTFFQMTQLPTQAQAGYAALLQVEAQHGSASELLETLKQMTADLPQEPEPKNDWAYLSLLLNTNVDEAWKMAEALVEAHPEMLAYRSTLALGYLRRNDLQGAKKVYQGLEIDWSTAPASWKMIYAVVLAADGNKTQAVIYLRSIDRSELRPEELALLNTYLSGN